VLLHQPWCQRGIARQPGAGEAALLHGARSLHSGANGGAGLARFRLRQIAVFHQWNLDVDVDAIQQRPADPLTVAQHLRRAAAALALHVAVVAAGTGIPATVSQG